MSPHDHGTHVAVHLICGCTLLGSQHGVELFKRFGANGSELATQPAGIGRELIDFGGGLARFRSLPQSNTSLAKLLG